MNWWGGQAGTDDWTQTARIISQHARSGDIRPNALLCREKIVVRFWPKHVADLRVGGCADAKFESLVGDSEATASNIRAVGLNLQAGHGSNTGQRNVNRGFGVADSRKGNGCRGLIPISGIAHHHARSRSFAPPPINIDGIGRPHPRMQICVETIIQVIGHKLAGITLTSRKRVGV